MQDDLDNSAELLRRFWQAFPPIAPRLTPRMTFIPTRAKYGMSYGLGAGSLLNRMVQLTIKEQVESWENEGGACR